MYCKFARMQKYEFLICGIFVVQGNCLNEVSAYGPVFRFSPLHGLLRPDLREISAHGPVFSFSPLHGPLMSDLREVYAHGPVFAFSPLHGPLLFEPHGVSAHGHMSVFCLARVFRPLANNAACVFCLRV